MSAVDVDKTTGATYFAGKGKPAWLGLGTVFNDGITDYKKIMRKAHMSGWNIHLVPLAEAAPGLVWRNDNEGRPIDQAVVRTNPLNKSQEVLGLASRKYGVVQNEQVFEFLQSLMDGLEWDSMGALDGGRRVFGSLAIDRDVIVDPSGAADSVRPYLLVSSTHDGSGKLGGGYSLIRAECSNTLDMALGDLVSTFGIRHCKGAVDAMTVQAELWRGANTYIDAFEAEAAALYAKPVTKAQYVKALEQIIPLPEKDAKGAVAKREARVEQFMASWNHKDDASIKGTGWGALQAITRTLQWDRRLRGSGPDGEPTEAARENFLASGAGFDRVSRQGRQQALEVVQAI